MPYEFEIEKLPLPQNITPGDRPFFEPYLTWGYSNPTIKKQEFPFVFLRGIVTSFLLRPIANMPPWPGFYKEHHKTYFIGKLLHALKNRKLGWIGSDKYYYCVNEFSDNYFHWFTEVLPKMIYASDMARKTIVFFFPFELSGYQITSLELSGVPFYHNKKEVTLFTRLHLVQNFTATGCYHPALLYATRDLIMKRLQRETTPKKKIYITRKNAGRRHLVNEDEVAGIMLRHGFEIVDFDTIDFQTQVSVAMNASILVSLHGAALTNMIFMDAGLTVIEFLPKNTFNDKCYFTLSQMMKLSYFYLFCNTDRDSHIEADYTVDTGLLEEVLQAAVPFVAPTKYGNAAQTD